MARLAVVIVCVILAACAPATAPLGRETMPPRLADDSFFTRDGLELPLRHWDARAPHAVIVALHGMADYSNFIDMPAAYWAGHGITTYAYDQRSFGASSRPGIWPGGDALRRDFGDCIDAARSRHPGVPVFALGESMGGAVVLTALASPSRPHPDGVILVAPAVWSRGDMPVLYRAALFVTAHTVPWMTLTGRGLKIWPSDNVAMIRKLSRDPLFQHATRTDAVWGLVNLMDDARRAPDGIEKSLPILMLYGEKDQIIPRAPTEAVARDLGARAEVRVYPKGYHMLLRDLEGPAVWKDIAAWIDARTSATASASGH